MYNEMCMTTGLMVDSFDTVHFSLYVGEKQWRREEEKMPRNKTKTYWMFGLISIASWKCTVSWGLLSPIKTSGLVGIIVIIVV